MSSVPHCRDELISFYETGRYSELIDACRKNLLHLTDEFGPKHTSIRDAIRQLAKAYYDAGEVDAAERELVGALDVYDGRDAPVLLVDLAKVYLGAQREADAEALCSRAARLLEQSDDVPRHVMSALRMHQATLAMRRGKYQEAERLFIEAKGLIVRECGVMHRAYGVILDFLSDVYERQERLSVAERILRKALAAYERMSYTESADYATALSRLGLIQEKQGQHADARRSHKLSLEILKRVRPAGHSNIRVVERRLRGNEVDSGD